MKQHRGVLMAVALSAVLLVSSVVWDFFRPTPSAVRSAPIHQSAPAEQANHDASQQNVLFTVSGKPQCVLNAAVDTSSANFPKMADASCYDKGYVAISIDVLVGGKVVATLQSPYLETEGVAIVGSGARYLYFTINKGGLGGYYLYRGLSNLYRLDLTDNEVQVLMSSGDGYNATLAADASRMAYMVHENIIVVDLVTNEKHTYDLPQTAQDADQVGGLAFSPDDTKLAFAAGYGPDNEHSAIYTLNLTDGTQTLVAQSSGILSITGWDTAGAVTFSK